MGLKAFSIRGSIFLAMIFGDKPFQITLARTKPAGNDTVAGGNHEDIQQQNDWHWDVKLPLDSLDVRNQFAAMILDCVQPHDDNLPATVIMTATPTNVGDEVHFEFENAFFRKRGKRHLKKQFLIANKAWTTAKEAVFWAWNSAGLNVELAKHVEMLCLGDNPLLVNNLQVGVTRVVQCDNPRCPMGGYHTAQSATNMFAEQLKGLGMDFISINLGDLPGVINVYDKDAVLSKSPFSKAIMKKLRMELTEMIKQGMTEFMLEEQKHFVRTIPRKALGLSKSLIGSIEQMKTIGLQIDIDPDLTEFINMLQTHIFGKPMTHATSDAAAEHTPAPAPVAASSNDVGAPPN